MKITLHRLRLPLRHPFTISRGSISEQISLVVELEDQGLRGWGEVTENTYYGQTFEALANTIDAATDLCEMFAAQPPEEAWPGMLAALGGNRFAASAVDMAAHDLHAQRLGIPTWQAWGLQWSSDVPQSSYTIGIDTLEAMQSKLAECPNWPIYKIKLGTDRDLDIVRALRKSTSAAFRVDANCAWGVEETIRKSRELAELNVEFIEQPLPADASRDDKQRVARESRLPIIADESCQQEEDVLACQGLFHGINVKICKCGGLTPAKRMLIEARRLGMQTMVGCMIESSIGISGAAQLLPLLDYADLDGAALLSADPAIGLTIHNGLVSPATRPGHGASLRTTA